jgi:uncharacterized protein (TIGR03437 family)
MKRIVFLLMGTVALGQTLINTGYSDPSVISVAPGQVVPLLVAGLKTVLPQGSIQAQIVPLPTTLAGISVTIQQTAGYAPRMLPLFSITQFNRCPASVSVASLSPVDFAACLITAITVQIPYDLPVASPFLQVTTTLTINDNSVVSQSFPVYVAPDQIHVLTSCDINGQTRGTGVCYPLVTHSDGRLVLEAPRASSDGPALTNSEAEPGETLVMYAYGLGQVSPPGVIAGAASPAPAATATETFQMGFSYLPNASPSLPTVPRGALPLAPPPFVGLTPGQVGLYQINFVVPPAPDGTQSCGAPIHSNLTVSITGNNGTFDGAPICVDTGTSAPGGSAANPGK